ncbi:hypothetical protein [Nocardia sp. XZ_19_385]|uniref:hypothetical protein n=1 Tax=Nocardia sp. XZ_19_385 TaxID=2769488 RepID=UPI0018905F4A|nr:hypothetical protein [Nocardia sp. XZ_19_385]
MNTRFAVAALTAIGVAAGLLSAAPAQAEPVVDGRSVVADALHGVDQGVAYSVQASPDAASLVTTVSGGAFSLDIDRSAVVLRSDAGEPIVTIPLSVTADGQRFSLTAAIADDGRRLTLAATTPVLRRENFISSIDWWNYEFNRALPCAGIGAAIGAGIGLIFLIVGVLPGAIIGAVVGEIYCGGQDLIDSGYAYWGGQP